MPGRPVRQGLSDGIGRGAKPFHLAVTLGPVAAPQTGVIVSLNRENVSPAEITSANFLTLGLDRTLLPSASSRRGS